MMRTASIVGNVVETILLSLVVTGTARAQAGPRRDWRDHGYLMVSGDYQASTSTFQDTLTFPRFVETETVTSSYKVVSTPGIDIAGGARIWRSLTVSVGVTRFTKSHGADVTASIPHPFFFNRLRDISGSAASVAHEETAVHVGAAWVAPVANRWQITVFGGPSYFTVSQGFVTDIVYSDSYPYDTATLARTSVQRRSKSKIGAHGGADVTFMFSRNVGAGIVARFSRATLPFDAGAGRISIDAGGAQVGGGLRLRF